MRDKENLFPGLMMFSCYIILVVCSIGFDFAFSSFPSLGVIIVELLAFAVPAYCIYRVQDDTFRLNFRWKSDQNNRIAQISGFGFIVKFALAVSFLSFLANLLIYVIAGATDVDISSMVTTSGLGNQYTLLSFIGIAVISPIAEEVFVRGAIFSAFEQRAGTAVSIVLSALCFAMLHGSLFNFVGPFIAGCAYALLAYSYDSIYPAICAHIINNCYYYIINYLIHLYSAFGIWKYFTYINVILFLLTLYLTLKSLETQMRLGSLKKFNPNPARLWDAVRDCLVTPGFFIFVASFIVSMLLK